MIEFGLGIAATLGAEFVLAQVYLWWENRQTAKLAANTATQATTLAWLKNEAIKLEGYPKALATDVEVAVEDVVHKVEGLFSHGAQTAVSNSTSGNTSATPTPILTVGSASGTAAIS